MTAASTLYDVRQFLYDLLAEALPTDVTFGWDAPSDPSEALGRSVWLRAQITTSTIHDTMPAGWTENFTQVVRIQCLPEDGSVDVPSADAAAAELLEVVVDAIEANHRPTVDGWSVVMTYGGNRYQSGVVDDAHSGYAASYEVDVDVEASRCS